VFHIAPPGSPTQDVDAFIDETVIKIDAPRSLFESKYAIAHKRFMTLVEEAKNYDLVVIGATRESLIKQQIKLSLPEAFALHHKKAFIMVKAKRQIKSYINKWL